MWRAPVSIQRISSTTLLGALLCFGATGCSDDAGTGSAPAPTSSGGSGATGGAISGGSGTGGSGTGGSGGSAGTSTTGGATTGGTGGTGGSGGSGGGSGTAGSGGSGGTIDPATLDPFSFFVTSMASMVQLAQAYNGSEVGFGGDLSYGTGDGLTGADEICAEIAELSMPGASSKQWHAFLSTVDPPVNAIDRIGEGPWYDRLGRTVAMAKDDLVLDRPNADDAIKEDLPNEFGVPNHRPDPTNPEDDNHHTLTGSGADGTLYGDTATCHDWTSNSMDNQETGRPRIGFSWSIDSRTNWISGQDEGGCGAGIAIGENGVPNGPSDPGNPIVGSGGGYGGIYCFAMVP